MKEKTTGIHIVQVGYDATVFEADSVSDTLARQLAYGRIIRERHPESTSTFLVLTGNQATQAFQRENVRFIPIHVSTRAEIFPTLGKMLDAIHEQWPIDSIATQTVHEDGMAALQFKINQCRRGEEIPVIGQIHYDIFSPTAQEENIGAGTVGAEMLNRIFGSLAHYDALRVVGSAIKANLLERNLHRNVHIIPVPVSMLSESKEAGRACAKENLVLFVGRLEPVKRLDIWLHVAATVCARTPDVRFEIVGDGSLRNELEALSSQLRLDGKVTFRGALPYIQLPEVYSRAKVFLLTSSYEGFGRVVAEAYAFGVPVVASRITGVEDIIKNGETGYLHRFDDVPSLAGSVLALLNDEAVRDRMGSAGEAHVRSTFAPDVLARKWVGLQVDLALKAKAIPSHGILTPRKATYSRYKKLRSMDQSLLRAMQYESIEGLRLQGLTLDIGGGAKNSYYHRLNIEGRIESVNMDTNIQPTYIADLNDSLPFPPETYDNVISFNTFEHILNDQLAVREAIRVLKSGGMFHFMVLFLYKEHGSPYDYHRHTGRWWLDFMISLGIDPHDVTVEPLVWDADTSAASIVNWQNDPYFRKWLMLKAVKDQRKVKGSRISSLDLNEFALGYYVHGTKTSQEAGGRISNPGTAETLHGITTMNLTARGIDPSQHSEFSFISKLDLGDRPCILDIGAGRGEFSLSCFSAMPQAHIISFEPTASTYELLQKSKALNPGYDWQTHNIGIGSQDGHVVIKSATAQAGTETVSVLGLPGLIAHFVDRFPIEVMKIDIGGSEEAVLEGHSELLKAVRNIIIVTSNDLCSSSKIMKILEGSFEHFYKIRGNESDKTFLLASKKSYDLPRFCSETNTSRHSGMQDHSSSALTSPTPPSPAESMAGVTRIRYLMDAQYTVKYRALARWFLQSGGTGTLLDIGARDRILEKYLAPGTIRYMSADMGGEHDFEANLEAPLQFNDEEFNHVVCLDVLEHVENIHDAFMEIARIAKDSLVVALPNMAVYSKRLSFLNTGHLGTGKYDLLEKHQGDRHRWLTTYTQMNRFIEAMAPKAGFDVVMIFEEIEGGPKELAVTERGEAKDGVYCDRCIYIMKRQHGHQGQA